MYDQSRMGRTTLWVLLGLLGIATHGCDHPAPTSAGPPKPPVSHARNEYVRYELILEFKPEARAHVTTGELAEGISEFFEEHRTWRLSDLYDFEIETNGGEVHSLRELVIIDIEISPMEEETEDETSEP